jgi:hypothetical protein
VAAGKAAVDDQCLPRDVRSLVGGEEEHGVGNFTGLPHAAQLRRFDDALERLLEALDEGAFHQRGLDEAGADRVHPDAASTVVDRLVSRQQHDTALRSVVRAAALEAFQALDAGDVDHVAAALLEHLRDHVLPAQEGALQVDVDDAIPLVGFEHVDRAPARGSGGIHEYVDATEALDRVGDRG